VRPNEARVGEDDKGARFDLVPFVATGKSAVCLATVRIKDQEASRHLGIRVILEGHREPFLSVVSLIWGPERG